MSAIKQQQYKHYQCSLRTKNRVKTGSSLTLHSEQLVTSWTTSKTKERKKTRTVCCHVHLQPSWWGGRLRRLLNCLHPFSPIQTINRDAMSPTCPRLFSDNLPFPHHDYHCHQPNKNKKNKIQIISAFQTSGAYQCPEVPQV